MSTLPANTSIPPNACPLINSINTIKRLLNLIPYPEWILSSTQPPLTLLSPIPPSQATSVLRNTYLQSVGSFCSFTDPCFKLYWTDLLCNPCQLYNQLPYLRFLEAGEAAVAGSSFPFHKGREWTQNQRPFNPTFVRVGGRNCSTTRVLPLPNVLIGHLDIWKCGAEGPAL